MLLQVEPVAVSIRTSSVIVSEDVIWVSDPERSRCLVSVKETVRGSRVYDQVSIDQIFSLCSVFNEDSVSHDVVGHVVLDGQVVNAVQSRSTVVRLVNGVVPNVRFGHCANHMVVDRIATKFERLADIKELAVLDLTDDGFVTRRSHHDMSTVLVERRSFWVASKLDISGEQADLSTHNQRVVTVGLHSSIVLVGESICEADYWVCIAIGHICNGSLLSIST